MENNVDGCHKIMELKFDRMNAHQGEVLPFYFHLLRLLCLNMYIQEDTLLTEIAISIPIKKLPYPWMRRTFARSLLSDQVSTE